MFERLREDIEFRVSRFAIRGIVHKIEQLIRLMPLVKQWGIYFTVSLISSQ